MRHKALEVKKAETLERIEAKLDLIAKALKIDFSVLEVSQPEAAPESKGDETPPQGETQPEAAPEPSSRKKNK